MRKVNGDHIVVLKTINAAVGAFNHVSGAAGAFTNVALSTENVVARSVTPKTAVNSVSFEVTDDEGNVFVYNNVNAGNIADFASLSL